MRHLWKSKLVFYDQYDIELGSIFYRPHDPPPKKYPEGYERHEYLPSYLESFLKFFRRK